MIRRLKRQFILITMLLTGSVLVGVLGMTLYATYTTQLDIMDEALDRALEDDLDHMPSLGGMPGHHDRGEANLLALAVDVSYDGVVIKTSRAPIAINSSLLSSVVGEALTSGEDSGRIPDLHVAWKRRLYLTGELDDDDDFDDLDADDAAARVVIVDTTAMDNALAEQVRADALITAVALAALFVVAWFLSSRAVAPVARAWEEQRRFVADASHELKTPLAVIIANTDILAHDASLPAESRRWVESTADEASHMRSLVNDLLELARTGEGAGPGAMRREDVDLSDLVDSAALEFDALAFERGCQIEAAVEPGIHVQGDPEWLARLAKILIDNACKYAFAGTTVTVGLTRAQGHVTLRVNNRGNVMGPEDLEHVFDRFYRSDKARARETGGFGLGLAIAKGIVETHGGKIWATSDEQAGTTFTVTL